MIFLIIQDDITPEDTALALESVGLDQYIYDHPAGQPWPTLGEMIDSGQRLVVMAEEEGPPPSWYQHVWDITMETPYTFINYDDFSCDANRGPEDAPFFLLNHWIQRGAPNGWMRRSSMSMSSCSTVRNSARQNEARYPTSSPSTSIRMAM